VITQTAPATRPPVQLDGVALEQPPHDGFMDPRGYFSPAFYDVEMRSVLPRSWVFVGDVDDLPNPGDFRTETIGYEPIVVVRGSDGELRALSNVCKHRASTLVEGVGNCGKTLTCPYHGWAYALDGRLTGVPYKRDMVGPIDTATLGLTPLRLEVWERWAFVNVSGDAPPLSEYLETMPTTLASHQLRGATRIHQLDDVVQANWKVLMDNAYCDYHLPVVHERTLGKFVDPRALHENIGTYTGHLYAPAEQGKSPYTAMPGVDAELSAGSIAFSVFPNWFIVAFPHGGCTVMWWTPLSIDTTRARVWHYTRDVEEDPRAGLELLAQIQAEDYAICEKVHRGLRSSLYRPGPQHALELRLHGWQKQLMRMLDTAVRGE
jgi:phenylpropionate dioxygenase-like ring-hydroxylating dioxygenase large terminal subunit